jgi:MFS family permease
LAAFFYTVEPAHMNASSRNLLLICLAAWLRSFGIGLMGVVLGVFLYREGFTPVAIGLVIAAGLAGAALATVFVTLRADRLGRRAVLSILAGLTALGAIPLMFRSGLAVLLPVAFIGMLNGMGTDRSAAFALEQAIIPSLVPDQKRTWGLAWYNVVLDSSGAFGALAASFPLLAQRLWGTNLSTAYSVLFAGFAILNLLSGLFYPLLTAEVEIVRKPGMGRVTPGLSPESKSRVARLASLFAIDSLGGGFLTDALVSYWFFRRFGIAENKLAVLFFVVHILNALSHLGAAALARRFGLLKTMVFTHLPSSIFLIAASLVPSARWAVVLFLLRESLVEMDVPTRQSYVAAVVHPEERTFASSVTNLSRNLSWAVSSSVAGLFMQRIFSAPLFLAGSLKIIYDLWLWRAFRHLKPPEEQV